MGRKRKDGDPLGLAGTRLSYRYNKFWYRHRNNRWEDVGTDVVVAKAKAKLYNDPEGEYGTTGYWLGMFLLDCEARIKTKSLRQRTLDGYTKDAEELKVFFSGMPPESITPHDIQTYIDEGLEAGRAVRANREIACLSSCISWLIRTGKIDTKVNPCMRASGVKKNSERKRERYVTHAEYHAVYEAASKNVRLMMELVYRTLQRPEIDVLSWTPAIVKNKGQTKVIRITQGKTGRTIDIALQGQLKTLVEQAIGDEPAMLRPIIHTKEGQAYTYDGISSMLKYAQRKAKATAKKAGEYEIANMPSFGFRDLKGKGATDMWLNNEPIERIQLLCGHADKATTEIYIKARWSETAAPNSLQIPA